MTDKESLSMIVGEGNVSSNYLDLGKHHNLKTKASCTYFVKPHQISEFLSLLTDLNKEKTPYHMLGGGFNIFFTGNYDGVVISTKHLNFLSEKKVSSTSNIIRCGPGVNLATLKYYSGFEFLDRIPGTAAAALVSNAGISKGENKINIGSLVSKVTVFDDGEKRELTQKDCEFGYRDSIFKYNNMTILDIAFISDSPPSITKSEMIYPKRSLGSIFKNPEGDYAGRLIEGAGFKRGFEYILEGKKTGVKLSDNHANILDIGENVNPYDICIFLNKIVINVYEKYNLKLEYEIDVV